MGQGTVSDVDEVILEDDSPELIEEFQNVDKHVLTVYDHERMDVTLRDMIIQVVSDVQIVKTVNLNGDSPAPTRVIKGVVQPVALTTAEQRLARKNELKARGTWLTALHDKHQLKVNIHKDAKTLTEAIKKRLQKLISQLEILGESLSQEDINLKFLKSLPTEWRTHTLIWRNKTDLEEQSLDDLFNNHKIYEAEVKSSSSASTSTQNIAFVSSETTDSTNEPISVVASVSAASAKFPIFALLNVDTLSNAIIYSFFASQSNSPQLDNDDLKQIDAEEEPTNYALMAFTTSSSSSSDNETVETSIPTANIKTAIPKPKSNGNHRNRKACFVSVLTKSKLVAITAARPVTAAVPKPHVTRPRLVKPIVTKPYSPPRRHINRSLSPKASNFPLKVTAVKEIQVSNGLGPKERLTILLLVQGNMSYMSNFEELNGRYVAFGGKLKGGKISGKGKIRTGKLDFDDVYFVKELQFNLFSVSQMCDKRNNVLFTDTECLVLSLEFKLPDENQVLLRVHRENNMYNVVLNDIVSSGDLTCLFAKATLDESNLWHRRLGRINFKTINKLVKGNLVRGLPTKVFENDHTCVACKKCKQHRASCKTKPVRSVNQPLKRTPSIGFMRPFSCPVTILNTLDLLGKFDGKVDKTEDHVSPSSSAQTKKHNNKTKREAKGKSPIESSTGYKNLSVEFKDLSGNSIYGFNADDSPVPAVRQILTNSTNTFSVVGPSNAVVSPTHEKSSYVDASPYPDDPNVPELKDITYSNDEEDVGAEADFTNLETTIKVSPILTNKVHKDHLVTQIIGDLSSTTQTRSMIRVAKDQEPKRVHQALKDPSWIEAMQEELLQFKMQKVWVLLDLRHGKRAIGHTQEEGIDYKEVFALVAKMEAIRLFLAYASFMGFMVYQMDVKSAFLYETIKEEKKDGILISQDKYVAEILRKFDLTDGKSASTPIDTEKPLLKDPDGEDVDVHTYRSMIGSMMYLTSSRPDIKLISWQSKKQTVMATFSTKVEYVAAVSLSSIKSLKRMLHVTNILSAGYITTPQMVLNSPCLTHIKNWLVQIKWSLSWLVQKQTAHGQTTTGKEISNAFMADASEGFDQIINFLNVNDVTRLQALVDKKKVINIEATIRNAFRLDDAECIDCLSNKEIFTELSRMGYENPSTKLTYYKLLIAMEVSNPHYTKSMSAKTTSWNEFSSSMASAVICLSTGKGFSRVNTPLFEGMLVAQQGDESVAEVNVDDVPAAGVADEGAADVNADVVLTIVDEPSIPSPTPPTQPPPPSQDLPSTSQVQPTPPPSPIAQPSSPQQQPQSSQDAKILMDLLHTLLKTCTTLTRRVKQLEQDKIAQDLEITKLKQRVKKLERKNKLKMSKLRRLKKVGNSQRVDTFDDTVMDVVSKQRRIIASMDADVDVTLKDVAKIAKEVAVDNEIKEIDEIEPAKLQEVVEVVTTAKLMTEVVIAASATITAAAPTLTTATAPTLTTALMQRKEKEDNVVIRYQALKRKLQTEAQARKNMMIYLRNMAGFKIDYFKRMKYDDIRLIFKKYFNSNVSLLEKTREQMEEDDNKALKRISESQEDKVAKKQKLDEEVPVVDYEIYTKNNKPYYKIIRADGSPQLFLSFLTLLKNFDREDLEVLCELVKERFASSKPKNFSYDLAGREKISTFKVHSGSNVQQYLMLSSQIDAAGTKYCCRLVSKYLNGMEDILDDGDPTEARKLTVEKSNEELELFEALDHKSVIVKEGSHMVVVFKKEPLRAYSKTFTRKMDREVHVEIHGFTFLVDFVVIGYANEGEPSMKDNDVMFDTLVVNLEEACSSNGNLVNMGKASRTKNHKVKKLTPPPQIKIEEIPPFSIIAPPSPIDHPLTQKQKEKVKEALDRKYKELEESKPILDVFESYMTYEKKFDEVLMGRARLSSDDYYINAMIEMNALGDTRASESVLPCFLFMNLGLGDPKPYNFNLTMEDNTQAKDMGKVKNVRIQIGYEVYLGDFLILDIPIDKKLPLLLGCPFLRTYGAVIEMGHGTLCINNEFIRHTYFPKPRAKAYLDNFAQVEEDDWLSFFEVGRDEVGNPKYGPVAPSFLDIEDDMERALVMEAYFNPFKNIIDFKKLIYFLGLLPVQLKNKDWGNEVYETYKKFKGDDSWHAKFKVTTPSGLKFTRMFKTKKTNRKLFGNFISKDILSLINFLIRELTNPTTIIEKSLNHIDHNGSFDLY
uniref:Putative ribonuclease H-like domain-containing protein n=1 Tax=Tanacetum cinerariifolium TaxID=118510 RepID=A0A6L2JGV7_TANCI|nr:putative ribonuclease H-like domain-containing protein [Tanacetum cinerariifolium]